MAEVESRKRVIETLAEKGNIFPERNKYYFLFSKSRFTSAYVEYAKEV